MVHYGECTYLKTKNTWIKYSFVKESEKQGKQWSLAETYVSLGITTGHWIEINVNKIINHSCITWLSHILYKCLTVNIYCCVVSGDNYDMGSNCYHCHNGENCVQ